MRAICKSGSMSGAGNGAMVGAVTHRRTKGAESSWGLAGKRSAERRRHCVSVGLVGHVGIAIQELFKGHHDLMPFQAGRRAIDFLSGKRTAPNAPEPHSLVAYRFAVGAEDEMSENLITEDQGDYWSNLIGTIIGIVLFVAGVSTIAGGGGFLASLGFSIVWTASSLTRQKVPMNHRRP
jgi:hypothetical protein